MERVALMRLTFGDPMSITSGCRCAKHNANEGGHKKSLHVFDKPQHEGQKGALALDVQTPDGNYRGRLFTLAWDAGFSIGWNARKRFLHLDGRTMIGLPQTSFDY